MLKKLGIVKSKTKGYKAFTDHIESDFLNNNMAPMDYVKYCWDKYMSSNVPKSNSLNGVVFELIISSLLIKEHIMPLYLQAQVAFVPNVNYDAVVYSSEHGPISLSLKTSLRERYKQADLEAVALKYVHRKAECYLLTIDPNEARSVKEKITNGAVLGLNGAILATSNEMNDLVNRLKSTPLIDPGSIDILTASTIITGDKVAKAAGVRA
jgi:hypothetical protein